MGEYSTIPLNRGLFAIVDAADVSLLMQRKWAVVGMDLSRASVMARYMRDGKEHREQISRVLLNPPHDMVVDHINGNRLDNRRCNLRICTNAENMRNTKINCGKRASSFKGVSWFSPRNCWRVMVKLDGRQTFGGYFSDQVAAAKRYDELATEIHGQYARTNAMMGLL
jgi:hypothetical protein